MAAAAETDVLFFRTDAGPRLTQSPLGGSILSLSRGDHMDVSAL